MSKQNNKRNIEAVYPLSPLQEGLLFHSLYAPDSGVYFEQFSCTLRGALDEDAFRRAWQRVVDRHPILRTSFVWKQLDKTLQVVHRQVAIPLERQDWQTLPPAEQAAKLDAYLQTERQKGFDLAKAPLMRLALRQTAVNEYRFVWNHHHLLLDGWSLPLVFQEVMAFYEAFSQGQDLHLPRPRPYRDYINWLQQQDQTAAENYWRQALQGVISPTPLVVDRPADGTPQPADFAEQLVRLSPETTATLQNLARQNQFTLSTLVQAAWGLLLHRYSGEADVIFGATVSGRPPELDGVEQMMGLFINTLPVRLTVDGRQPIVEWLQQLQAQLVEMQPYSYSSLAQIQGWSDIPRGAPLFESILVFENYPVDEAIRQRQGSLAIADVQAIEQTNYPLNLISAPEEALPLRLIYDSRRFDADTISRMLGHLTTLLAGIATEPNQPVADLPLLTTAEQRQILVEWNDTAWDIPLERTIHELFEEQADQHPEATAVTFP
ncbi:MAG TPA: non-ribosomal peptide synthetase, partial [Anaerolineae bacterium]|nr:non-ribosomal peptide synthetase [Anaerolineae bacterium]